MIFSLFLMIQVRRILDFNEEYRVMRFWLVMLEVFLQLMLVGRIILLFSSEIVGFDPIAMGVILILVLVLTELVPCSFVVWSMVRRL